MKKITWIIILLLASANVVFAQPFAPTTTEFVVIKENDNQARVTQRRIIENDLVLTIKDLRNKLRELKAAKDKINADHDKAILKINQEITQAQANIDEAIRLGVIE